MTDEEKQKITIISQEFAQGFEGLIDSIEGSGWLIVDPLSGYLNSIGYPNTPKQLPECDMHPQVLMLEFPDGSRFIPAGADLKSVYPAAENCLWI